MPLEFKSRTFILNQMRDEDLKDFKDDIELFTSAIVQKDLDKIVKFARNILFAKTRKREVEAYKEMVCSRLVPNCQIALASHRIVRYFSNVFSNELTKDDSPEELVEDVSKIGVSSKGLPIVKELLKLIKKDAQQYHDTILKEIAIEGIFPTIKGFGTTVEMRGVFSRELEYGESLDHYSKEVRVEEGTPLVPVVSVSIKLTSGTPDRICFQASPEIIEWLIEELRASLHKLSLIKKLSRIG